MAFTDQTALWYRELSLVRKASQFKYCLKHQGNDQAITSDLYSLSGPFLVAGLRNGFGLNFLGLLSYEVVQLRAEGIIDLLSQRDLSHLELSQVVGHNCVLEVGLHHLFESSDVLLREDAHALVDQVSHFHVFILFSIHHILNVPLALL